MKKTLLALLCLTALSAAHAECRRFDTGFGNYTVRCDDGNQYRVQKNELLGTTQIQGSNNREGSQWNQTINNNGITTPTMRGTDKDGNSYNCRMNTFTNKWQCN